MTGPATAIIRNICNKRRNSDLRADDRDINAALNERISALEDALRAAEPLLRGELGVMVNSFEPNPTLGEQAEIDALRGGVEKVRKALGVEFS